MERVGMGKLSQGIIPTWAFSALSGSAFPARCGDPCEAFIAKIDHGSVWNRSMVRRRENQGNHSPFKERSVFHLLRNRGN